MVTRRHNSKDHDVNISEAFKTCKPF